MLLAYGHAGLMSTHQLMNNVCERMYGPRSCDATCHAFLGNSSLGTVVHLLAVLVQVARKDMGCGMEGAVSRARRKGGCGE